MSFRWYWTKGPVAVPVRRRLPPARTVLLSALALSVCTVGMLALRPLLAEVHVALLLLLVVLGASAAGGPVPCPAPAAAAFILFFVFFFSPPQKLVFAQPPGLVLFSA